MGGTLILSSIFLSVILWGDLENRYLWVAFLTAMSFGVLGWIDDRLNIKYNSSDGLSATIIIFCQSFRDFRLLKKISSKIRHIMPNDIKISATLNTNQ